MRARSAPPGDLPSALDFDREWHRAAEEDGTSQRISRNVVRTIYAPPHGSGMTDTVRLGPDALVNVINCVVPRTAHWVYADQEPLITLRASLACDVEFRYGDGPPLVFDRPELTLTCIPPGLPMSAHIAAGARQQGIVAVFRARSFAARFGLLPDDLPPELRSAIEDRARMGRVASFPIDHRIAALVADTLDSRLHGELRTVQLAGRLAELVAYALEAMLHQHGVRSAALPRRRDLDLARAARDRLDRDYRRPPNFAALAREFGTSQNKLKVVFKQAFGLTMADYCLERRVREAQQLLMEATLTIAQVAERVGYEHQSSFAAAFSGHVGMSPREYRRHRAPFSLDLPPPR
ncbi:MAG: helix-turn-helix transcriptional regulator [Pseudomonadota bacterium]